MAEPDPQSRPRDRWFIVLIAIIKLGKSLICLAIGIGLIGKPESSLVARLVHELRPRTRQALWAALLDRFSAIPANQFKLIDIGAFVYAFLFAVEGVGLLSGRRWAEWMVVVTTSLLVPLEIYEMAEKFSPIRLGVLVVNVAVVIYLVNTLRRGEKQPAKLQK